MGRRGGTLEERLDLLNPRVVRAVRAAHAAYTALGVRHALIGGLAVGVHGHPCAAGHVEFLVGPEAFETHGVLVTFRPGIPLSAEGVPIDSMLAPEAHEASLAAALEDSVEIDGVPVIRPEALVLMKLIAGRRQDLADIAALLRIGAVNADRVRARLAQMEPEIRDGFEALVADAER
jgi:hypothetical protein